MRGAEERASKIWELLLIKPSPSGSATEDGAAVSVTEAAGPQNGDVNGDALRRSKKKAMPTNGKWKTAPRFALK
jgi:hypothetical protein